MYWGGGHLPPVMQVGKQERRKQNQRSHGYEWCCNWWLLKILIFQRAEVFPMLQLSWVSIATLTAQNHRSDPWVSSQIARTWGTLHWWPPTVGSVASNLPGITQAGALKPLIPTVHLNSLKCLLSFHKTPPHSLFIFPLLSKWGSYPWTIASLTAQAWFIPQAGL